MGQVFVLYLETLCLNMKLVVLHLLILRLLCLAGLSDDMRVRCQYVVHGYLSQHRVNNGNMNLLSVA